MKKEIADKILRDTEAGYDFISEKFSETRKHFWRNLEFLKDYARAGDRILDFGCGNGRLLELIGKVENIEYCGTDVSEKLIEIAKQKYPSGHFQKTDPIQDTLSFDEEFFNAIYSIAVFHHFPSKEYRQIVVKELYRVTKKDGYIIVTVWNLYQRKYVRNIIKNWIDKIFGKSDLDWNDCYISFSDNHKSKIQRFHHAFSKRELKKLFENVGFKTEKCEVIEGRNILYIGKK